VAVFISLHLDEIDQIVPDTEYNPIYSPFLVILLLIEANYLLIVTAVVNKHSIVPVCDVTKLHLKFGKSSPKEFGKFLFTVYN